MENKFDLNDAIDFFKDAGFTVIIMDDDQTDIGEQLRMEMRGERHADLARKAADEIDKLRTALDYHVAEIREVRRQVTDRDAEIQRLRLEEAQLTTVVQVHVSEIEWQRIKIQKLMQENLALRQAGPEATE